MKAGGGEARKEERENFTVSSYASQFPFPHQGLTQTCTHLQVLVKF